MDRTERCKTCRFWHVEFDDNDTNKCRRFPPTIFTDHGKLYNFFPRTVYDDWCGEWQTIAKA
jgi:hypothetical protein